MPYFYAMIYQPVRVGGARGGGEGGGSTRVRLGCSKVWWSQTAILLVMILQSVKDGLCVFFSF